MMTTLRDWLDYIERQHASAIALGLERVRWVAARMGLRRPARHVITVGGTNGKGSTVAFIEAIARAQGLHVGAYTSPHLLHYNERVRVDGQDIDDAALVAGFEAVEAARDGTALTYFEYGTLCALWLFQQADLDLAVLEVGMGGRLDAVNVVDADAAIITTVALDHQAWLGEDVEAIGFEKAGIARAFKPLVLGDVDPPASVLRHAYAIGAPAWRLGSDFFAEPRGDAGWRWREVGHAIDLPLPLGGQGAPAQIRNAACAIAALRAVGLRVGREALQRGLTQARVPGRLQRFLRSGIEVWVDVAHNPQAAQGLAEWLQKQPRRRTLAVFSALADKDAAGVVTALAPQIDGWYLAGLDDAGTRSTDVAALAQRLSATLAAGGRRHPDVATALATALADAQPGDRVLAFGSFHVVAAALRWLAGAAAAA